MAITEQDLRRQLETLAAQAAPPGFAIAEVAARIRRRRARNLALASAGAALVLAAAVALPVALTSGKNHDLRAAGSPTGQPPQTGPVTRPVPNLQSLTFTVTMNGLRPTVAPHHRPRGCQTPSVPCTTVPEPGFAVSPGERLDFRVTIGVPARASISGLWVGISDGTMKSPAKSGGPFEGFRPILLHLAALNPGHRTVPLSWTIPARTPIGTVLLLSASWAGQLPLVYPPAGQDRRHFAAEGTDLTAFYVSRR